MGISVLAARELGVRGERGSVGRCVDWTTRTSHLGTSRLGLIDIRLRSTKVADVVSPGGVAPLSNMLNGVSILL